MDKQNKDKSQNKAPKIKKGRHLQKPEKKKLRLSFPVKLAIGAVLVVVAATLGVLAFLKHGGQAPEVVLTPTTPHVSHGIDASAPPTDDADSSAPPTAYGRDKNKFTFVVFGTDKGGGNTDVVMVATLDTKLNTLNVVNIPRDTLVNVSWNTKKVNSLLAYEKSPEGAVKKLADILGYEVDFYAVVNLTAFEEIVDAIGGIDFNVPRNMNYDDDAQNFHVHINKGQQHLNGKDALGVVRFRNGNNNTGYATGDIGRIETQQKFLMAAAGQILEKKSSINVTSIANIFLKYVKTNLDLQELVWFSKELFKLSIESVTFTTMPGDDSGTINGNSYVTIYVDEWLKLINEKLNPFTAPLTLKNFSIYTRDANKQLYVTDGHYEGKQDWGRSGSSSSSGSKSTPKPTATPTPTATPMPSGGEVTSPPEVTDIGIATPAPPTETLPEPEPSGGTTPDITPELPATPEPVPSLPEITPENLPILTPPPATPPDPNYAAA